MSPAYTATTSQPCANRKAAESPSDTPNRIRSVGRRPIRSLSRGISKRPAALPTLPSTTLHRAAPSSRPRSMPSFRMMGLNRSTAGVEKHTAPAHSQYCFVFSICHGERSISFLPFPCWFCLLSGGSCSSRLPARQTGSVMAPSAQNAPRIPCTGPKPFSAVRTNPVRNAPLRPTAPPMTPVARPLRPAYHFWAQDWMDG